MAPEAPGFNLRVQVFEPFVGLVSDDWLRWVGECALALQDMPSSDAIDVVVADDETLTELNRRHRGLDETTDVLSFSLTDHAEYHGRQAPTSDGLEREGFVLPPGEAADLGEVIISYPQAARQAEAAGCTVERELALLLVHGILHLMGYDHAEPDEEESMKAKVAGVLARVFSDE